jgi:UDP-3-O-[3-hydroxymyristoyl] N-acetylglucosamine deacetylase/3-hydroxyacyl-[acyl-carrier-protein] dehydratase
MKQKTIKNQVSLSGVGLHTGALVNLTFKPAEKNAGIKFIRVDMEGKPEIIVCFENIARKNIGRCTTLECNGAVINTVEHLMAVLCGLEISNLIIEADGEEVPGLDGSGLRFWEELQKAGIVEQDAEAEIFSINEPIGVEEKGSSIYIVPSENYKISYTLDYEHPALRSQFFSTVVDGEKFQTEIAPSRTFCMAEEADQLRAQGFGKGANFENTLVVGNEGVVNNKVRFSDEFARHKVLDLIGDLYLLGVPIRGHIFAVKSGHMLNYKILKKIHAQRQKFKQSAHVDSFSLNDAKHIGIESIMAVLPHRYPFLLVDRVFLSEEGKAIGIKNVTINDGFFQGHFPKRPVMPGVLMVEAMAQVAGVMVMTRGDHQGKMAFFMAIDKVKFRRVVVPGDQLVMEVEMIKERSRVAQIRGVGKVAGEIAVEAEMMFTFAPAITE